MTPAEIAEQAERLKTDLEALAATAIGYGNYKQKLAGYQVVENDQTVLIRELAKGLDEQADTIRKVIDGMTLLNAAVFAVVVK